MLRRLLPGDLNRILDGLGQDRRIAHGHDLRSCLVERVEDGRHCPLGIDRDRLAGKLAQRALERIAVMQADAVAQMLLHLGIDLLRIDEQIRRPVRMDQREGERDRGAGHIFPANIERPGDRIERRQNCGVSLLRDQPVGDLLSLIG